MADLTQLWSRTVDRTGMAPTHRSLPYDHLPAAASSAERVHSTPELSTGWVRTVTRSWMI
jgi:hypothetical protein